MINRRKFIKNSFLIAGSMTISRVMPGCNSNIEGGKELFSFVQLNDTHLYLPVEKGYPKTEEKLRSVISSINVEQNFKLPDFVLFVGDIIDGNKLNLLQPECEYSKMILNELKCPYYTVVGNHEVLHAEGNPRFLNAYIRNFGEDKVNYSFIHKGFQFILFDNSNGMGNGNDESSLRNEWLMATLEKNKNYPKIIVCHIPLVAFREDNILNESFSYWSYKMSGDDTLRIIENHSDKVIAILNGHVHLTGAIKTNNYWLSGLYPGENDIFHISPSGLASYPCHYAHFTVYENKIDIKMIQVNEDLVTPSTNIHGKYYHEKDFTDAEHITPESYVTGNKDENKFSILLPEKKRAFEY